LKAKRGEGSGQFVPDGRFVHRTPEWDVDNPPEEDLLFEKAGARERIFFDPAKTKAAIVTCGGLSPGLNNVIRSAFLELHMNYGVREVVGIRHGYQGLNASEGDPPLRLTMELVEDIHRDGGTILGTSRGHQKATVMADFLVDQGIDILFCVGGDGTQRGALALHEELARRGLPISIVGIPKTIDNDIAYCDRTFGFTTAVAMADIVIDGAHVEAKGARYGIGLVKLMGREAGFIAAAATLASQEVNFTFIPEVPLVLEGERGFLALLHKRMLDRRHAVIVTAEGAGQDLLSCGPAGHDASGNVKLQDIGPFLKDEILAYFSKQGLKVDVKYIDPSYIIRSVPANSEDDILCDQFGRRSVHAAMAGKTGMLMGRMSGTFAHVPIAMSVGQKRRVNVAGELWNAVLSATGQPPAFS
jgi:6-phosphofructokinase 1